MTVRAAATLVPETGSATLQTRLERLRLGWDQMRPVLAPALDPI
jgi:hypothetical protein